MDDVAFGEDDVERDDAVDRDDCSYGLDCLPGSCYLTIRFAFKIKESRLDNKLKDLIKRC